MPVVRTYEVHITRIDKDPAKEAHIKRRIHLKDDGRADEGFELTLFIEEIKIAWRALHRMIRKHEVGEE